jgi:hypothetical protein
MRQRAVPVDQLDDQLVAILSQLKIPNDFRQWIEGAVRSRIENAAALTRMAEIQEIGKRIDFRWEEGFIDKAEYVEKRRQLQREMESLRPIDYDELIDAADLIQHFKHYWQECAGVDHPAEARKQLVAKMVERVFVYNDRILAIVLYGDLGIVLGQNEIAPSEIEGAIEANLRERGVIPVETISQFGDDGPRLLTCILLLIPPFAVIENPLFNTFAKRIAESRDAKWYFAPRSILT